VKDPESVPNVARWIAKDPRVAKTDYAADTVQKLLKAAAVLGRAGLALIVLLSISAAIVIANTIRLTVFARRREIAIMQLVGATNMYIRMPFIAEGMLAGILGAALAIGVLALAEHQIVPKLASTLAFVTFQVNGLTLCIELLAVGAAVGLFAAWFSVGRHLRT
jgi:cell division transport system permease protein